MKIILFTTSLLLTAFGITTSLFGQEMVEKVLYTENFNATNELNWPVGENEFRISKIINSNYSFEHVSDDIAALVANEIPVYIPNNFYCNAAFKMDYGVGAGFGIIFGYSNRSNFHTFNISTNGYFRYGYYENGKYKEPVNWTQSSAIEKNGFNDLKVHFDNNTVSFFINSVEVSSVDNYRGSFGAKLGFIVYDKQRVTVDYLKVAHLTQKAIVEEKDQVEVAQTETNSLQADTNYDDYPNKYALVVGNSKYSEMPLANPVNDANAITAELEAIGFEVIKVTDATRIDFRQAIREFSDKLADNPGVGLFYYAGHGLQANGINYLVPVEASIQKDYEIEDECIRADLVLRMVSSLDNPMNVIILDACRNNPFARSMRSAERGLAQPQNAPTGSIIAFATAPGSTASDGDGENGLYTQELIKAMRKPGLSIERVFKEVRINVSKLSNGEQIPWENSSLMGDFYFRKN